MSFDNAPILHERQEPDSMLCAQHALNALLQESFFSADQLADIGHRLDELEAAQLDPGTYRRGHNVDDSGFFSVGVLEEALKVHNLRLVRWDSEELRPMHSFPEEIPAFVLNLQEHWFTIRRFANNGDLFFNLNSFLKKPERVSKLYLGMQIQQAQQEGYSIFAVIPASLEGSLPPCAADEFFAKNAHLALLSHGSGGSRTASDVNGNATAGPSRSRPRPIDLDDDDDGDSRPAAQRRRVSPPNDDEVVTSAMRESSISDHPYGMDMDMDEEEMMRRAMEESLREVAAPRPAASPVPQSRVEQPHWRPKSLAPAPKAAAGGVPASGSGGSALGGAPTNEGDEDDSPSVEELRRRRLARFK